MLGVTILGNNSAIPAYDRHPTAQVVTLQDQLVLIDCGEGTQMQLSKFKVKRSKITHILISHLHGDHYFGIFGLVTSMGLFGRTTPLHIYSPAGLEQICQLQFAAAAMDLPFPLYFHVLTEASILVEEPKFIIRCFPVSHRIPCFGFVIEERKKPRKIIPEKAIAAGIPASFFDALKLGENYTTKNGETILNEQVTVANTSGKKYAFCADTQYLPSICTHVQQVDVLYHETTYLKDLEERAALRFHSTTHQAANIALQAQAKRLLIGHFSSKYEQLTPFLEETKEVFPNTDLALEGVTYIL